MGCEGKKETSQVFTQGRTGGREFAGGAAPLWNYGAVKIFFILEGDALEKPNLCPSWPQCKSNDQFLDYKKDYTYLYGGFSFCKA